MPYPSSLNQSMRKILPAQLVRSRLPEVILVTFATVGLMVLANQSLKPEIAHMVLPCVLAAGAIIPSLIRNEKLSHLGLTLSNIGLSLKLLLIACLMSGPIIFIFLLILDYFKINIPLASKVSNGNWAAWITYQLMYVSVAEELFFRGYILSNLARPTRSTSSRPTPKNQAMIIGFSAVLFALAHIIILQSYLSALTFFPGLLFGWLFIRTGSLAGPILFHAIANITYALLTAHLT